MFNSEAAAEIIALCEEPPRTACIGKPLNSLAVYGYFGKANAQPLHSPTEIDIHLAAQTLAETDPDYLDQLMLYSFECPVADDAMTVAAEIAQVARMRVDGGFTAEPWAMSVERLGRPLSD